MNATLVLEYEASAFADADAIKQQSNTIIADLQARFPNWKITPADLAGVTSQEQKLEINFDKKPQTGDASGKKERMEDHA